MKHKTKLGRERIRRGFLVAGGLLASTAAFCSYVGIMYAKHGGVSITEILVWLGMILFVGGSLLGFFYAANDAYRVSKEEIIRQDGQMPFSKTYYIVEHHVLFWWLCCRSPKGKQIRFRSKKEACDMMNAKIKEWNIPLVNEN